MDPDLVAGIDVGLDGGVALMHLDGGLVSVHSMPTLTDDDGRREIDCGKLYDLLVAPHEPAFVIIELVGPYVGNKRVGRPSLKSTFSFGRSFEAPIAVCQVGEIRYECHPAQSWQKAVLGKTTPNKEDMRAWCANRFPDFIRKIGKSDGKSDAVGLAEYARLLLLAERKSSEDV